MTAKERNIFMRYLLSASNELHAARKYNDEQRSEKFPMVSKELVQAQTKFDLLCGLANALDLDTPVLHERYEDCVKWRIGE